MAQAGLRLVELRALVLAPPLQAVLALLLLEGDRDALLGGWGCDLVRFKLLLLVLLLLGLLLLLLLLVSLLLLLVLWLWGAGGGVLGEGGGEVGDLAHGA